MQPPDNLIAIAIRCAAANFLDPALVCALIEQESSWNMWATRYEPAFFAKYVAPLFTNNKISASEAWSRGYSWGLMQVMGQVARENGFAPQEHPFLSELCDPEQGIAVGCRVLARKFAQAARDFRFTPPSLYSRSSSAASAATSGSTSAQPSVNSSAPNSPSRSDPSKGTPPRNSAIPSSPSSSPSSSSQLSPASAPSAGSSTASSIVTATPTDLALITRALLLWNGGSNSDYPRQVLARLPHYA